MKPVILVQRTAMGNAFHYSRIVDGKSTHIVETEAAPVGKPLVALEPFDVEVLRERPEQILGEVA